VSILGLTLALGSALCWAGLDATRKELVRDVAPVALVAALTLGQAPLFAVWGGVDGRLWTGVGYLAPGLAALGLNVAANVTFVRAVQLSPLSLTIPYLSLTPVFTAVFAVPLVGETPSVLQSVGIGVVVAGALLLHAGNPDSPGPSGLLRAYLKERGSVLMSLVALMWSLTGPLDKLALGHASVAGHALVQTGGVGLVLLAWLALRGRVHDVSPVRGRAGVFAAAVAFATVAAALQLLSIQLLLVALVETIKRAVGMTAAVAVGRVRFGEPVTAPKLAAIALMTAGTALVTLG